MRRHALLLVLITAVACAGVWAQEKKSSDVPPEMVGLLLGPERADIPCKFKISKPILLFQQQYLVKIRGVFPVKIVERGELRNVHLLVKLQDEHGHWLDGSDYEQSKVPKDIIGKEVEFLAGFYLRPGAYRMSVALYDTELRRANVYHRAFRIPALKPDPLPGLDEKLPIVEFPGVYPSGKQLWPVSLKTSAVEISNSRPARLDIVLNVNKRTQSGAVYLDDLGRTLSTASILGRLRLANGCVRVSVIDVLRMSVILDRQKADAIDWKKLQAQIEAIDQNTIDVSVLENQRRIAAFTREFLEELSKDDVGCRVGTRVADRNVVVVSHDFALPGGEKIAKLAPLTGTHYFYVHYGIGAGWMNAMGQILSSGKPEHLRCLSPLDLRKAIAKIITRLEGGETREAPQRFAESIEAAH